VGRKEAEMTFDFSGPFQLLAVYNDSSRASIKSIRDPDTRSALPVVSARVYHSLCHNEVLVRNEFTGEESVQC
jgi:hypothetical protein